MVVDEGDDEQDSSVDGYIYIIWDKGVLVYLCVHACAYAYDADSRVSRCLDTLIEIGSTKNTFQRTSQIALVSRATIGSSSLDDELRAKKC